MEIGKRFLDKIYNIDIKVYTSMFEEVNRLQEMVPHLTIYLSICRVQKSDPLVLFFVYIWLEMIVMFVNYGVYHFFVVVEVCLNNDDSDGIGKNGTRKEVNC